MLGAEDPPVVVSDKLSGINLEAAGKFIGAERSRSMAVPTMGSEDFSRFTQLLPAAYFRIGCYDEDKGYVYGIHTPEFDFDEKILPIGAGYAAYLAWELLRRLGN